VTGASARLPGWLDRVDRLQGGPRAVMPSSEGGRPMTCTAAVRDSTVTGMISLFTELLYSNRKTILQIPYHYLQNYYTVTGKLYYKYHFTIQNIPISLK
jgi:hypothetical protein